MNRVRSRASTKGPRPQRPWRRRLPAAMALAAACVLAAGAASAGDAAGAQAQIKLVPPEQIFTFLFLMLGPLKLIGPFAKLTQKADAGLSRKIAILATLFSSLALLLAAFLGQIILDKYGISIVILTLSGGLILLLVALPSVVHQFTPLTAHAEEAPTPTVSLAMTPLASPTIVTPYGVAALIVFLALSTDLQDRLMIGGMVVAIMLLNLVCMLMARQILRYLGVVLQVLGAILGVVQVALALKIINTALRALWSF